MKILINIAITLICLPWPALIMMSPMMIAAKDFASSNSSVTQAILFFIYPSFVFLLLKATGFQFYGTNPVWWALGTLIVGILVAIAYSLPQKLYNLSQGISNYGYFIQQDKVYFNGVQIKGADAKTFIHYGDFSYYSKDKNHVYYNNQKLPQADAATFGLLLNDETKSYWHDKKYAYYKWEMIPNADGASFKYIGNQYACDKHHVFYENQLLEEADVATFKSMEGSLGRDANNIFVHSTRVTTIKDIATFEMIKLNEEWFGKDKEQVYALRYTPPHPLLPFPGADPQTFVVLGEYYAKDKNQVYYYSYHIEQIIVLKDANPETFRLQFNNEKNTDATDGERFYRSGILYTE